MEKRAYVSGEAITNFGGYNWHVISDDGSNVTLLMDAGQIEDMSHCESNNDNNNNCTYNGSNYVYSWDKSLINMYFKETLYLSLKDKIENISGASCNSGYESDYVRLITYSEYWNLSPSYSGTNQKFPNVTKITRLSASSDSVEWLYCNSGKCEASNIYSGNWWTMTSLYHNTYFHVMSLYYINYSGGLSYEYGERVYGVRPVITIRK